MLRVERTGNTAIWTMDRPDAKNAINQEMLGALQRAVQEAARDTKLRAVILTGAGQTFSAGADLREARDIVSRQDASHFSDAGEFIAARLEELRVPVIAAISGVAFGGGAELAMACDLRIADTRAKIAFKQVRMGVCTAWGTLARLIAVVGHGTASRLLMTAHEIGAMEARVLRLIDHVADDDGDALAVALAWAADIEQGSPDAVAAMKALLLEARRASYASLRPMERDLFVGTWCGPDHKDAVAAFFERRTPAWINRGQ